MGVRARVAVVGAVLVVSAGGAAAWASIPSSTTGVFTGCYAKSTGSLRLINAQAGAKCTAQEQQVRWSQQGPAGPAGPQGVQGQPGTDGAQGPAGPAGPGATSFSSTHDGQFSGLLTSSSGLLVIGDCGADYVGVRVQEQDPSQGFRAFGTVSTGGAPVAVDPPTDPVSAGGSSGSTVADVSVVAHSGSGAFVRVDAHGDRSGSTCTFEGMLTPAG